MGGSYLSAKYLLTHPACAKTDGVSISLIFFRQGKPF